jgi:hypothetical protein
MGTGAFGRTLLSEFANNSPPSGFVGNTHSGQPHEFSWRPRDGIPVAMAWPSSIILYALCHSFPPLPPLSLMWCKDLLRGSGAMTSNESAESEEITFDVSDDALERAAAVTNEQVTTIGNCTYWYYCSWPQ